MRVGWVSPKPTVIGGAEMGDRDIRAMRPDSVEVVDIDPYSDMKGLESCDRVVISRVHRATSKENTMRLVAMGPVVRSWGIEIRTVGLKYLHDHARAYLAASDLHWKADSEWVECPRVGVTPGYRDLSLIDETRREHEYHGRYDRILWAHRNIWHKGLDLAIEYAERNERSFMAVFGMAYLSVLDLMARSTHFILLSKIIDAAPFSVIEAQLLGCETIVNSLVGGWFDGSIRDRVEAAPKQFWDLVLDDVFDPLLAPGVSATSSG